MKKLVFQSLLILLAVIWLSHCSPERPVMFDASVKKTLVVVDTTGLYDPSDTTRCCPVGGAEVILNSKDYIKTYRYFTGPDGKVEIEGLLASTYDVNAKFSLNPGTMLLGGRAMPLFSAETAVDTIMLNAFSPAPLVMNEIYYCGPKNNAFFFFDQFVELFNRTDSVVYVDGMIVARIRSSLEIRPYIDTLSYVQTVYAYQFPGTPGSGREYPVPPGQHIVIASDAYDHSKSIKNAVNLENADWEFYHQFRADYDNPDVPNLTCLVNKGTDFLIALSSDGVILADGTEWEIVTVATEYGFNEYVNLPLHTIVDGVEYKSGTSTQKNLTYRIDAGFAGVGISKYSGYSIERIDPHQDTNNSTVDFHNLESPSPGYQK